MSTSLPVAIIGGGPVGLAAAAHLLERGEDPLILESGTEIASSIKKWQHIHLFSPWMYNIDAASKRLLNKNGWEEPPGEQVPTGRELRENYLIPLSKTEELRPRILYNSRVVAVSRKNRDKSWSKQRENLPFLIHYKGIGNEDHTLLTKAVIDASGTWETPNPIGSSGIPAIGEKENSHRITYGIPDILNKYRAKYRNKRVMIVGSGHSAMHVLLDLQKLQETDPKTGIVWIMRSESLETIFGGGQDDELPARGELGLKARQAVIDGSVELFTPFLIQKLVNRHDNKLIVSGDYKDGEKEIAVDEIIATTGFRPDLDMIREIRTDIDPALESVAKLAPMIDPNEHSCGTVPPHGINELKQPEQNFFIAGSKSYGRAPTFLMMTGYEQVRSIAAYLTGDLEGANRIELNLPDTGVCKTDAVQASASGENELTSCCADTPSEDQTSADRGSEASLKQSSIRKCPTNSK